MKATRRKILARALVCNVPTVDFERNHALNKLTVPELKTLLRAAGIGIPQSKPDMVSRLVSCQQVTVSVSTEAVVFNRPKA